MLYLSIYLVIINAAALLFMLADKWKAVRHTRRIPEATLLTLAFVGGSLGSLIGMFLARHKTRRAAFLLGIPAMLLCHLLLTPYFLSLIT